MEPLLEEAWRIYATTLDPCVVRPSILILYFGDYFRYANSPLKVITVALNPSHHEFPAHDRFKRFRHAEGMSSCPVTITERDAYFAALNSYIRGSPYMQWFSWPEHVLLGMDASYLGGQVNTALHTDLCSPLATDPTWSRLHGQQEQLIADGMALWHRLVEELAPDVILASVARQYLDQIAYANSSAWQPLVTIPRKDRAKRPYRSLMQRANLVGSKKTLLVFGPAAQQPFATLTREDRRLLGRAVREAIDAG
jgi:hypothetical protein